MRLRPALFSIFLSLIAVSLLFSPSLAQCPQRCHLSRRTAINDCRDRAFTCIVTECVIDRTTGRRGRMCARPGSAPSTPTAPSRTPSRSPTPSPSKRSVASKTPRPSEKCSGMCFKNRGEAKRNCRFGSDNFIGNGCRLVRCPKLPCLNNKAHACVAIGRGTLPQNCSPSSSSSPQPTGVTTEPPTPTAPGRCPITPTPNPIEIGIPDDGFVAAVYKDPHIKTFDGLNYDCQAAGEFQLLTTADSKIEVQGRFVGTAARGTMLTAIAIGYNGLTAQISIPNDRDLSSIELKSCPLVMYVNGGSKAIRTNTGFPRLISVKVANPDVLDIKIENTISLHLRIHNSDKLGCHFSLIAFVAASSGLTLSGILGTPDGNFANEWTRKTGTVVTTPGGDERLFVEAYSYCTDWCNRDPEKSIFKYESGTSFADFQKCNTRFRTAQDLNNIPAQLKKICGESRECAVDGLAGDICDARDFLVTEAEVGNLWASKAKFKITPASIAVGKPTAVRVTVDLTGTTMPGNLDGFVIYRLTSNSLDRIGTGNDKWELSLVDTGLHARIDENQGSMVFSNVMALQSSVNGESFSYLAAPVIDGMPKPNIDSRRIAWSAIRSYSDDRLQQTGEVRLRSGPISTNWRQAQVVIVFSYTAPATPFRDLDSSVKYDRASSGTQCDPNTPYISNIDNKGKGEEMFIIDIGNALSDGIWTDETVAVLNSNWNSMGRNGPALLTVYLKNQAEIIIAGSKLTKAYIPGPRRSGCPSDQIARVSVTLDTGPANIGEIRLLPRATG